MLKKYQIMALNENNTHLVRIIESNNKMNSKGWINLGGNFTTWEEADLMARLIASREINNLEYVSMR